MAWWDHEELKAPEDRSARYKRAFPEEYEERNTMIDKANTENKPKYIAYSISPTDVKLFWSEDELKEAKLSEYYRIFQIGNEVTVETKIEIVAKPVYRGK